MIFPKPISFNWEKSSNMQKSLRLLRFGSN